MIEKWLYNCLALPLGLAGARLLGLVNDKIGASFQARRDLFAQLEKSLSGLGEGKRVLVHISSVGEYLQARAVLRAFKEEMPGWRRILSFFSPSLEPMLKKGAEAELVSYLPFDRPEQVKRFLDLLKPRLIIFSCYDLWPNLIWQAKSRGIKVILINASLGENSFKLNPLVSWWFRRIYDQLDLILCASPQDRERILQLGINPTKVFTTGNTRFEETIRRIAQISPEDELLKKLRSWKKGFCLVVGSSWEEDEQVLIPALEKIWKQKKELFLILAPHEPKPERVKNLKDIFSKLGQNPLLLSELEEFSGRDFPRGSVIIEDKVGRLYKLYQLGEVAFVGGSFRREVHNVMEPAGFGLPVLLGPKIRNSQEAVELVARGGAKIIHNSDQFCQELVLLMENEEQRKEMGKRSRELVEENQGAVKKTLEKIFEFCPEVRED